MTSEITPRDPAYSAVWQSKVTLPALKAERGWPSPPSTFLL